MSGISNKWRLAQPSLESNPHSSFSPEIPLAAHLKVQVSSSSSSPFGSINIFYCRTEFESRPDRGLLGKSVLRHFNRFTNYVVKGALGTLLICTLFPLACIVVSYTSLLLALLAPILIPLFSLVLHLAAALVYDWETGRPTAALLPSLVWHLLLQGILQPALCTIGLLLCPIGTAFIGAWAVARKSLRHAWDTAMFELVIRKRARVPAGDSFVARRIGGSA